MQTIKNRSKNTIKEYYYDLRNAFKFFKKDKLKLDNEISEISICDIDLEFIKKITLNDLYKYLGFLSSEYLDKPATRARKVASLRSFFNYLSFKKKVLDINPTVELETPTLSKRIPRHLSLEESRDLLYSIKGKFAKRDFAIITLFLNCGLRLSELTGINMINIKDNMLSVIGKGDKERTIYLNNSCQDAITKYIAVRQKDNVKDKDALFLSNRGVRISNRTVETLVKKHFIEAGIDPKKYSPHKLRHTAATLMHKHGKVDIRSLQQILGHESISTTQIYTHIDNEQLKEALNSNPLNNI
jgi:site-specific recombinase XerD